MNKLERNMVRGRGLLLSVSRQDSKVGSYKHGNGPSGSIKVGEFLDHLRDYQPVKMNCAVG
jgi:hypothetical protein